MRLIVTVGMPGSGKEEFLTAVKELGHQSIRMGDVVREFYTERNLEDNSLSISQFADIERKRHGFDIWARRTVEKISELTLMIDGCRSMDEIEVYRKVTGDVRIIGILASPKTRYKRLVARARDDAPKDIYEFQTRDRREINWGLAEALVLADHVIVNESSLGDFKDNVEKTIKEVLR
ncbi:MAG: AAA family ATPase [archaeon]|nr:AAA family ATPase [archaeon]